MHKNVKVLIVILSILVALGYVIWLKNKLFPSAAPALIIPIPTTLVIPTIVTTPHPATNSATASAVYNSSSSAKINNYGN